MNTDIKRITSEKIVQPLTHSVAIQTHQLEIENLKTDLQTNSKELYEHRSYAESIIASLNEQKAQLQKELTRKEEECELLKKEDTTLKTTGNINNHVDASPFFQGQKINDRPQSNNLNETHSPKRQPSPYPPPL